MGLADYLAVMDDQVLRVVVGRDEPEALLVAEPLDGSGSHCVSSGVVVLRTRRLLSKGYERWHRGVGQTTQPDPLTVAAATISAPSASRRPASRPCWALHASLAGARVGAQRS